MIVIVKKKGFRRGEAHVNDRSHLPALHLTSEDQSCIKTKTLVWRRGLTGRRWRRPSPRVGQLHGVHILALVEPQQFHSIIAKGR